jgi:hypothetical protein
MIRNADGDAVVESRALASLGNIPDLQLRWTWPNDTGDVAGAKMAGIVSVPFKKHR